MSLAVVLCAAAVARAQAPSAAAATVKPTIVVIPARGTGGPDLTADAKNLFDGPLGLHATVLPFETYRRAVLGSGHLSRDAGDFAVVRAVAPTIGATHAVVVEGIATSETERGKSVRVNVVRVSLVAASGDVLYTTTHTLNGVRLTRSISTPIVAALSEKLEALARPAEAPQPTSIPAAVAAVPVPPEVPPTLPVEPVPPPPVIEAPPAPVIAETPVDSSSSYGRAPEISTPIVVDHPAHGAPLDVFSTLDARIGMLALARDGRINGPSGRSAYDGPLVATNLSVSYFPWAKRDPTARERGVGVYAEGYLTRASTDFRAASATSDNTVAGIELGAAYRFALGLTDRAPALSLQLGYAYSTFPMSGVPFPALSYSSLELGFLVDVPIGSYVSAFAGGRFFPWMSTGGNDLGAKDSLYAMRGELGMRVVLKPFELAVSGRYQQHNGTFNGVTSLQLATELQNARLVDRYYGGVLSVGYLF